MKAAAYRQVSLEVKSPNPSDERRREDTVPIVIGDVLPGLQAPLENRYRASIEFQCGALTSPNPAF